MSTRVVERVDDWDTRPFTGGIHELHDLADDRFSGVVRAEGAELFMIKGTVVGIKRGSIDSFEAAEGTVYEAPSAALPLLAIMQEHSEDVRAKYYSEDTPMSDVDDTLSDGNFTGFIELSENVLSGDYYLVYHNGESMAVGFVGNTERLITTGEAFETADNEVGIYEVKPVDIDPIDIPEPEGERPDEGDTTTGTVGAGGSETADEAPSSGDGTSTGSDETAADGTEKAEPTVETDVGDEETVVAKAPGSPAGAEAGAETADVDSETAATSEEPEDDASAGSGGDDQGPPRDGGGPEKPSGDADHPTASEVGPGGEGTRATEPASSQRDSSPSGKDPDTAQGKTTRSNQPAVGSPGDVGGANQPDQPGGVNTGGGRQPTGGSGSTGGGTAGGGTAGDLETRAIPSLDPDRTGLPDRPEDSPGGVRANVSGQAGSVGKAGTGTPSEDPGTHAGGRSESGQAGQGGQHRKGGQAESGRTGGPAPDQHSQSDAGAKPPDADAGRSEPGTEEPQEGGGALSQQAESQPGVDPERMEELEDELNTRETEIRRLESDLDEAEAERDQLEEELASVREERDELQAEIDRLEDELRRIEEEYGVAVDAERRITANEALDGTDIFVRYHSKGDATLEKAHGGSVRKDEVTDNLRLENHTQFDAQAVAVGGEAYGEFLEGRPEWQFVRWLVQDLLFEIRDTGHAEALRDLYDALPHVDRAELNGVVSVTFSEDGQETRTQEAFDVVFRDRMGNPLFVTNLNDSREGATDEMMTDLITSAERVGRGEDTLAGAFLVTRSFFEPDALETASEATRSGILSRDKRMSFVNLSRKQGYHLCLVEARNENFHLAVPEL